jgi:LAO/AO transport system kinase
VDREGAEDLTRILRAIASYQTQTTAAAKPPKIVKTVATTGEGIHELILSIDQHWDRLKKSDELTARVRRIAAAEVIELARREVFLRLNQLGEEDESAAVVVEVAERRTSPEEAADQLVRSWQATNHD